MSSITWDNNRLIQRVGNDAGELGYVDRDENSGTYVLWLRDTSGVLDLNGGYMRGDEFGSLEEARKCAASSASAFIMHYTWMRMTIKSQAVGGLEEHWEEIAPELGNNVDRQRLRSWLEQHLEQMPIDGIKQLRQKDRGGCDCYRVG